MKGRVNYFPNQRVSNAEKGSPTWYEACIDYVIEAGLNANDRTETEQLLGVIHDAIPDEFYRKTLNPYNTNKEKFTRFPATMRNLDIIKDVLRRYVSEYIKGNHEFIVSVNNPDFILAKDHAIKSKVMTACNAAFIAELTRLTQEAEANNEELIANGQEPQPINPDELINPDEFAAKFTKEYIDELTIQAGQIKDFIDDVVDNDKTMAEAFFNWVALGECYTYHTVRGEQLIKESVSPTEMYPVPNGRSNVDEFDMVARRMLMSINQIHEEFEDMSEVDSKFLQTYYSSSSTRPKNVDVKEIIGYYPDRSYKFPQEDNNLFGSTPINLHGNNNDLIEVWHTVWRGYTRVAVVTKVNEAGFIEETVENDDFVFDSSLGHISISYEYKTQIHEGYRIGNESTGIYPVKSRAINYQHKGRLPFTGVMELIPQFGQFSIIKTLIPFQILINIFSYHREMIVAKNKMFVIMIAKSLLGTDVDDTVYRMAAQGLLPYDDDNDSNSLKAQQARVLTANMSGYITEMTNLINSLKQDARDMVDMTPQRYGTIANSAGKGVTDEAINRGSMGSVIVTFMFNKFRERDYDLDMGNSKLAWIDGINSLYFDSNNNDKFLSLDVNKHVYSDYVIRAKNSEREADKLKAVKDWAFSAAQNGDMEMALAAITGNTIPSIEKAISSFSELKRQHEAELRELDAQLEDDRNKNILEQIAAKGEQDRLTAEVKAYYAMQADALKLNLSVPTAPDTTKQDNLNAEKLRLDREKVRLDSIGKERDRQVKLADINSKVAIARENRNKYDGKSK